jgi:hypothetical protein
MLKLKISKVRSDLILRHGTVFRIIIITLSRKGLDFYRLKSILNVIGSCGYEVYLERQVEKWGNNYRS